MPSGSTKATSSIDELVAGRYRLTQLLARGAMGEVYAATDESTKRDLALKRMRPEARSATASLFFTREYHALAELKHPRIIEVYDFGVDAGVPYYTMELLDGQDLRDLAPLPPKLACSYLRDVASSLALLHARRLLHRDLSPRNVRLTSDGHCKLIDFGTMVSFGTPPNIAGTPPLVPPEALRGAVLDQRSDLYALGALAYFLLTGKHGYAATTFDELQRAHREPLVRPRKLMPEIPTPLEDLVTTLMRFDPTRRPRSAADVIDMLSAIGELPPDNSPEVAQSFLSSSQLVGRVAEQKEIVRRLERARTGHGSALLIDGDPGTGRTRLLDEAVRLAQTRGFLTVQAVARGERGTETLSSELAKALNQSAPEEAARAAEGRSSMFKALAGERTSESVAATGEARARLQTALTHWFCGVARERPLLVAVDDIDRADDFSAALVAALAHEARALPLIVIATRTKDSTVSSLSALTALRQASSTMTLTALDKKDSAALVSSLFGDVPNTERVSEWLYRVAHGNPSLSLELAEHLITQGLARYIDGTWVLPSEEIVEAVPSNLIETLGLRLSRLRPAARALAELMSVRRGGLSLILASATGEVPTSELLSAFDELARLGIAELAGDEYAFAQRAMLQAVRRSLTPEREAALHERLARALLDANVDTRLEAGWHLVHTKDELRGADLLADVGPQLVAEGINTASAIPAIEKALAVYEKHGRPLAERLRLRSHLVLSAYLFDYRLADRYGDDTIATLYEVSGIALADRLRRHLSGGLALVVAVALTNLKRLFTRKRDRAPSTPAVLMYFCRSVMGLMGLRTTGLDGPGVTALAARLGSFEFAPRGSAPYAVWLASKVFALQPLGRQAELADAAKEALHVLERRPTFMQEVEHQDLVAGLMLIDGINACFRGGSQALERAAHLERSGTLLASAYAKRIRLTYHTVRGDRELADRERKALDLQAIQGGTTWQVEWFGLTIDGVGGAMSGDLLTVRRTLDKMDALLSYVPSLEPFRDAVRLGYHYRRGEYERAIELGERFVQKHAPRSVSGWNMGYAFFALALVENGRANRALEVCDHALAGVTEQERTYYAMYTPLFAAQASAHAVLGDVQRADGILHDITTKLLDMGEHAGLAVLHETHARVARRLGDHDTFRQAIHDMRRAALRAGNISLIAMADHLSEMGATLSSNPAPPSRSETTEQTAVSRPVAQEERTAIATFLLGKSHEDRSHHALQLLAEATQSSCGFLYEHTGEAFVLRASLDDEEPPAQLKERIVQLVGGRPGRGQYVVELASALGTESVVRFHIIVLAAEQSGPCVAIAALREGDEPLAHIRSVLLEDVGAVLAERDPMARDPLMRDPVTKASKPFDVH